VLFTARIDHDIRLPGNTQAHMFTRGLTGAPYLALKGDGEWLADPHTGERLELLPTDRTVTVRGIHHPGGGLPLEVTDAMRDLSELASKADRLIDEITPAMRGVGKLADNLNELFAEAPAAADDGAAPAMPTEDGGAPPTPGKQAAPTTRPADERPSLKATFAKLGQTIDGLNEIVGDRENRENLKLSLANLAATMAQAQTALASLKRFSEDAGKAVADVRDTVKRVGDKADKVADRADDLVEKLIADAEKISSLLTHFNIAAAKIAAGEGTAGRLVHDNDLYEGLVAAARELTKALADFRALLAEWKKSGVPLKLK
jgi:ABC-type transporter Mla subunit MlaD